jgi:hypothetical protein
LLYRRTAGVARLGTLLAVTAIATLAIVGGVALLHADFHQAFHLDGPMRIGPGLLAGFGTALYITLYDYVGYADCALLGDEIVAPARTIPRAIVISVLLVAFFYVALQIGILGVVPWKTMLDAHGQPTAQAQFIGSLVVQNAIGRPAAIVVTILILVTAFASLYGNLLGFSRIPFAAARDGAFLPGFERVHPRKQIPHVALLAIGGLSLVASLFTLDQVIAFLTAGIVLIQGLAQIVALARLRLRTGAAPFAMPLYPLPALIALVGWTLAFIYTGALAIALGVAWLVAGAVVYVVLARARRWWPFAGALLLAAFALHPAPVAAAGTATSWQQWNASAVTQDYGYPVFTVDGKPFWMFGAAFFYERIPRERWRDAMLAYRTAGVNTLDLYTIWNWHEPTEGTVDFTGATDPRRDLLGVLRLAHELGFKIVLRPGPVIRNEWRNGGYPDWLLRRSDYAMPLHDILEGRYPATATLQNANADAAASEWLANTTHRRYAAAWLHDVLTAAAPYAGDIIAIALDDDQGAYIDNDTWPAPHWHAYIDWLRDTVRATAGARVPLFINTFEMKVTASSPVWAWGDWYQSDAYSIGAHDLAQLDFSTGLLQTQPRVPVMMAEFQAGWLQGADEARPRPSDPSNTALTLGELLRDGAHGIVDFPLQDTTYPAGWEAPWANWSYAWDAALTDELQEAPRYAPTAAFARSVARYGTLLARTHRAADAAIVWPATLFRASALTNADFGGLAAATTAMQQRCAALELTCDLLDLRYADDATLGRYPRIVLPIAIPARLAAEVEPAMAARMNGLRRRGALVADLSSSEPHMLRGATDATLLAANDGRYGFIEAINPSEAPRRIGPMVARIGVRDVKVAAFELAARSATLIPIGISGPRATKSLPAPAVSASAAPASDASIASPLPTNGMQQPGTATLANAAIAATFYPAAGARIRTLTGAGSGDDAATSIGLLRDAVDPQPSPSARDYIAAYTHPIDAGTFNRPYACAALPASGTGTSSYRCSYDAPDLPAGGGHFERTLSLAAGSSEIVVDERLIPTDASSGAHLVSISGFAYQDGDDLVVSPGRGFFSVAHGGQVAWLRWRPADVAQAIVRRSRGAAIVELRGTGRELHLGLGVGPVGSPQAPATPQANRR